MSIYKNGKLIAGGSQALPLLTFMWADHQLNDISWLRADTFSWQSGAVYQAAYAHLADDIDGKTLQSETIGSTTIQFYLADDGHKICPDSEESNVAAIYAATGVAWYYIIDTTNQRFKLPRSKWGIVGLRGNVGDYVPQDVLLPNITANNGTNLGDSGVPTGSFVRGARVTGNGGGGGDQYRMSFDASLSSAVYSGDGTNTLIQPRATQMYLYFYVGQFTQTALENTAGINTEMFNDLNAHKVIDFQEPTSANNYTWYRKYADGWVEQGGIVNVGGTTGSITLAVEMADTNYQVMAKVANANISGTNTVYNFLTNNYTTTGFGYRGTYNNGSGTGMPGEKFFWQVSGIAA